MNDAARFGRMLGVNFKVFPIERFREAMDVELEHGTRYGGLANVTNNELLLTAMIVVAHLIEFPDYYERLEEMEKEAKRYWRRRRKPEILLPQLP